MHLIVILAVLCTVTQGGLVRVPKVYNALISSDKNLTPSHTIPVVEPVIRTTALGVAFPPIFVHTSVEDSNAVQQQGHGYNSQNQYTEEGQPETPRITYHGSLYPVTYGPYLEYPYTPEIVYHTLPIYQQPYVINIEQLNKGNAKEKEDDYVSAVNFKKNPEVPDVPPPPLPVKSRGQMAA